MSATEFWHTASDGKAVFVRRVAPEGTPRAVMHIAHGLGEHGARYVRFAEVLRAKGFLVFIDDHRGHGKTGERANEKGFFDGGIERVVKDLSELIDVERKEAPGVPFIFFGHSMGSYLAQELMLQRANDFRAVVLSGTAGKPSLLASAGRLVARLERLRSGPKGTSGLLTAMSFGAFNKPFTSSGPTKFEWLSRDRAEVDKYAADPWCGFDATTSLWVGLLDLLSGISQTARQAQLPKALPVYVMSGSDDMTNERTAGLKRLLEAYRAAGLTSVTERIYQGARHELLNETNRDEVTAELVSWLESKL